MKRLVTFVSICLIFSSFNIAYAKIGYREFNKIYKSPDANLKFETAKMLYETGEYNKAIKLLENISRAVKGTDKSEITLYLLANCYFKDKDYYSASHYFETYVSTYVRGMYVVECQFNLAYCYYLESPEPELDQTPTYKAIEQFQNFIAMFPNSVQVADANKHINELNDKLAQRELKNAKLYYNLGNYRGNNYKAAIVTSHNALNDFPDSQYKEEFSLIIVRSKYHEVLHSVQEKIIERSQDAWDECYYFLQEYPETKHKKEIEKKAKHLEKFFKPQV